MLIGQLMFKLIRHYKTKYMKKVICIISLLMLYVAGFSQFQGKKFIFDLYAEGKQCDILGAPTGSVEVMPKGGVFTVERVTDAGDLVINFLEWKKAAQQEQYNHTTVNRAIINSKGVSENKPVEEAKFFLINKAEFERACSEFERGSINFGTMITPFKFRFKPSAFETNLNLGACIAFQFRAKYLSAGVIGGLSLSAVTLDEYSTDSLGLQGTDRPAVTPSIHLIGGYKKISLTVGFGWDIINKKSAVERKWFYNGRTWFGVGIGVNLFTANESKTAPAN